MFWILELSFLALKLCLVTERMMLQIQQVVIGFLWSMAGLSLGDRVRSLAIWGALRVKLLLLHINLFISTSSDSGIWLGRLLEASYVRFFCHVLPGGGWGRPQKDFISQLALEWLDFSLDGNGKREIWASLLRQLPNKRRRMDGWMVCCIK